MFAVAGASASGLESRFENMRALLIYPRFPESYWSFETVVNLIGRKAMHPPLALVTVAALLPDSWELRLVDHNVRDLREEEWEWADLVLLSAMLVQKKDFLELIREARRRGKKTVVGGPYATSLPDDSLAAGADYLVLDEGEITIARWLDAMGKGEPKGVFRADGEKPDVTRTPVPRFDLLELDTYTEMTVQYSRGCPFLCEFCDIIVLYGRRPRTKEPEQMLRELERLYQLGWRRSVFVVDDNFIGNRRNAKQMLRVLIPWQQERGYPFSFSTEASVDLAGDQELMDLMTAANFGSVFLGIETPDQASLVAMRKKQNVGDSLAGMVRKISQSGLRVTGGFIIGFDGEPAGAGERIQRFVEENAIPLAYFSMLQALPGTALWQRLEAEGRLRSSEVNLNQTTLTNFLPDRPIEEIAREYVRAFRDLYEPRKYLDRTYRHYRILGRAPCHRNRQRIKARWKKVDWRQLHAFSIIVWRQGILRRTRPVFWRHLFSMLRHNPGGVPSYLSVCAYLEHFLRYRESVEERIGSQLELFLATERRVRRSDSRSIPASSTGSARSLSAGSYPTGR